MAVDFVVGEILIPVNVAAVTYRLAPDEVMPLAEAVTVVLPTALPFALPVVLFIEETTGSSVAQIT